MSRCVARSSFGLALQEAGLEISRAAGALGIQCFFGNSVLATGSRATWGRAWTAVMLVEL